MNICHILQNVEFILFDFETFMVGMGSEIRMD